MWNKVLLFWGFDLTWRCKTRNPSPSCQTKTKSNNNWEKTFTEQFFKLLLFDKLIEGKLLETMRRWRTSTQIHCHRPWSPRACEGILFNLPSTERANTVVCSCFCAAFIVSSSLYSWSNYSFKFFHLKFIFGL